MRDLYLDIDGVLNREDPRQWREDAAAFLQWSLRHFLCFFLTGWPDKTLINDDCLGPLGLRHLSDKFGFAKWNELKTEGIVFERDFYWLDDEQIVGEMEALRDRGVSHNLIRVNPTGEAELKNVATILARRERLEHDNPIPDLSGKVPEIFPEGTS